MNFWKFIETYNTWMYIIEEFEFVVLTHIFSLAISEQR